MASTQLLDCDTHFTDHEEQLWDLPAPWPRPEVVEHDGHRRLRIGDLLFPRPQGPGQGTPKGLGHLVGPGHDDDRGAFMAENGVLAAVLQPGFVGLSVQALADPADRTRLAERYNDLAAAACATSPLRLRWSIVVSAEDPEWSRAEVTRHGDDVNAVAATVRPTARTRAARLNSPAFDGVLDELAGRRLALFVHGGTGCYQWSPLADGYEDYTITHALGHMGEQMIALADLLTREGGLPDGLGVVLLESGVAWIPSFLSRLDSHAGRLGSGPSRPGETFARHFGVVPDPGEPHARWALAELGWDGVLFGSDYPHWDCVRAPDWLGEFGDDCAPERLLRNTSRLVPRLLVPEFAQVRA